MTARFLLGSSYFHGGHANREAFARIWNWNNQRLDMMPSRTVIVAEAGSIPPIRSAEADVIHLSGDLGHIGSHLNGSVNYEFTGWSASMCALAMLAYTDCSDFIYKEEDCLAFGPWVERMYADMGDRDFVFGHAMRSAPHQLCSQSLFLVRHRFIPTMVSEYLALGKDGHVNNTGENKFYKIEQKYGSRRVARLTFGVDRERPIHWEAPVFYAQQWSDAELDEAKRRGLI